MPYDDIDLQSLYQTAVRLSDQATSMRLEAEVQIAVPSLELENDEYSIWLNSTENIESIAINLEIKLERAMRKRVPIGPLRLR